jgi:hypothetical protein
MADKLYTGSQSNRYRVEVLDITGKPHGVRRYGLRARQDLERFTRHNFNWGCCDQQSRQLALALLADAVGDQLAKRWNFRFWQEVVSQFARSGWTVTSWEITEWVARCVRQEAGSCGGK